MTTKLTRDGTQLAIAEPRCVPTIRGPVQSRCARYQAEIRDRHEAQDYSTGERGCTALCDGFLMPQGQSRFGGSR